MIREKIADLVRNSLKGLGVKGHEVHLEHPENLSYGDYSTNIALIVSAKGEDNPIDLAKKIVLGIEKKLPEEIEKIEVAGPGFINFFLSKKFFAESLSRILKDEHFGSGKALEGKKVIIEYTNPNPFKEIHLGHLMNNTVGESIFRILDTQGGEVKRAIYQGDVGLHVAKAVWGLLQSKDKELQISDLAKAYQVGDAKYEEDEKAKKEIEIVNKKIYDQSDQQINNLYNRGKELSMSHFEAIYKRLGTKFDFYFLESKVGPFGKKIVEENIGKVFEKSDAAIVYRGEKHGLHTRVFITKQGLPTYEAKELGLAKIKHEKFAYDKSFVVTANEVNEYFKVVLSAMKEVFPELAEKTEHISHGFLRLPHGKMSSRKGTVISAESLLNEVEAMIHEKIAARELIDSEKNRIAAQIAIGAIKYSILKQSTKSDIVYDFDKSISFDGDSGPYLQYSATRASSVIRKAEESGLESSVKTLPAKTLEIERLIYRFPEVVKRAYQELEPHYISTYLIEIAAAFNSFYANNQIMGSGREEPYRLAITKTFRRIIEKGLWLLGIEAPKKM